ncbi:adenosine deaminase [Pendulispora rubella]|uniref:adenosine deaminase n=1 Tax=Pendulispora rubella TaxID=2741070 RepID=A0ABZ2L5W4_9BACT
MKTFRVALVCLPALLACSSDDSPPPNGSTAAEQRVQQRLDTLASDEKGLRAFVQQIPKGADLHNHLSGSVAIEKYIQWAAEDGFCTSEKSGWAATPAPCTADQVPISNASKDSKLFADILSSWSMEGHTQEPVKARHEHFFATFDKFDPVMGDTRYPYGIADALSTAAKHHQTYVELMRSLDSWSMGELIEPLMPETGVWTEAYLLEKRAQIVANSKFQTFLDEHTTKFRDQVAQARALLKCGTAEADPGCNVDVRFMMESYRTQSKQFVFGQWLYGFELAQKEPLVVGVNIVSPEEAPVSLQNYNDEMFAVGVLAKMNAADATRKPVHVSLHAGELIPDVLPQNDEGQRHLTFHVDQAVEAGRAERIGHGTDVLSEVAKDPGLFDELRARNVLIEVSLKSSSLLLGYEGERHPLGTLIQKGVPVALSTDDQSIFRTSITEDWLLAIQRNRLSYVALKKLARAGVEHSFLPGKSLWAEPNRPDRVVAECAQDNLGKTEVSKGCLDYVQANERAALQWKLERELAAFESSLP